jgi:hypothetical protein
LSDAKARCTCQHLVVLYTIYVLNWCYAFTCNILYFNPYYSTIEQVGFAGLAELLPKVAMEDKTVIITSVNEAWAQPNSLLDLYLESFKNGEDTAHLLSHVLVVALDPAGFDHCKAKHPHCYLLKVESADDLSSAKRFMSKGYLDMVWTKLTFQQRILELGYNFLFTVVVRSISSFPPRPQCIIN